MKLLPTLALAAAPLLAPALSAAALVELDFTAQLRWGGVTGAYTQQGRADFIQGATTGVTSNPFDVSGRLVIDTQAPPTVTFSPASGYWSSEAFSQVEFRVGGSNFRWLNAPGTSNGNYGLTLANSATTDIVRTGSVSGPTVGGIDSLYFSQILPQPVAAPGGVYMALGSMMFEIAAPGLLSSNLLDQQSFDWGAMTFGQPGDAEENSLFLQFLVVPTTNTKDPAGTLLAQNAAGRFTSLRLATAGTGTGGGGGGSTPVAAPAGLHLSGLALALAALMLRQRRAA